MSATLPYDPELMPFEPPWQVTEDLHLHTTASDGLLTPTELVKRLGATSLRIAAITDHDTVDGIDEALNAAREFDNLTIVPGIEMSAHSEKADMHIIGLFINHRYEPLLKSLSEFQRERENSIKDAVDKLTELGLPLEFARVRELARGVIGRPHIARAMMEKGYVDNFKEAFDKYLGTGQPAHITRRGITPAEALNLIHGAGGVGVLAHPRTVGDLENELPPVVDAGLVGIEVYAEKYRNPHHDLYLSMAKKYALEIGGGSDYHANGNETEVLPGVSGPPSGSTARLYQRALQKHGDKIGFKMDGADG